MHDTPRAPLTGEQYVNNLWATLGPLIDTQVIDDLPTALPTGYSPKAALRHLLVFAFDSGLAAGEIKKPTVTNPYDVAGLTAYGSAVQLAWAAGFTAGRLKV